LLYCLATQWPFLLLSVAREVASMAMAMWARAATMLLFYQVAFLQFTLWGIRVALLKISKFDAWLVARQIMFLIHIVAIAALRCQRQLSSGVNMTHRLQAIQVLHLPHFRPKCALYVALPITIVLPAVVSAMPLLIWLKEWAIQLPLHPLLQLPSVWLQHLNCSGMLLHLVAKVMAMAMLLQLLPLVAKVMAMAMLPQLLRLAAMEMAMAILLQLLHFVAIPLHNLRLAMAMVLMAMARAQLATLAMALPLQYLLAPMADLHLRLLVVAMVKATMALAMVKVLPRVPTMAKAFQLAMAKAGVQPVNLVSLATLTIPLQMSSVGNVVFHSMSRLLLLPAMVNQAKVAVRVALSSSVLIVVLPIQLITTFAINVNAISRQYPQKASMARALANQTKAVGIAPHVAP
jgi:hypothetical protein